MAWTTPGTAVAGDVLTAARWNSDVRDNSLHLYQNTAQTIEKVTLGSTGNISFSSIPQTYSTLRLVCRVRAAASVTAVQYGIRFNSDTASNYSFQFIQSNNTTVTGGAIAGTSIGFGVCAGASADASNFSAGFVEIPQYSITTTGYKAAIGNGGNSASSTVANSFHRTVTGQWHSTAAITSIQLFADNATTTFVAGSYAILIGMP